MNDVVEPTRMPSHVRALCWGGPRDGEVMLAPRMLPPSFGRPMLIAKCGPSTDGAYALVRATWHEQVVGQQLLQVAGDPRDWPMAWRWHDADQVRDLVDQYDAVLLGEKMTRVLMLCDFTVNDDAPYRPSQHVQDLADDLGMQVTVNTDGSVSFTYPDGEGGLWIP